MAETASPGLGTIVEAAIGHAFGMQLRAPFLLEGLLPGPGGLTGTAAVLELTDVATIDGLWAGAAAQRVREARFPDGQLLMSIDRDPTRGYRVNAPGHGQFLVSVDGARIDASLEPRPAWRWQLVLFAQVLPLAVTLAGGELWHASAVAIDGRAYALVAPAGTGKSSIAMQLLAQGATFVTDDALAVGQTPSGPLAHPGARFANVHRHELQTLSPPVRALVGRVIGESTKLHVQPEGASGPLPLAGLFFIERHASGSLAVQRANVGPEAFLLNSFIIHVRTTARMARQLDACATLARTVPTYRVAVPPEATAAVTASALLEYIKELG